MRIRRETPAVLLAGALAVGLGTALADPAPKPDTKFRPTALGMDVPVLTSADDLDKYVSRLVAVQGRLNDDKPPRILGVEVYATDDWRHDEPEAYAVGILGKFTVTEAEYRAIQNKARKMGNVIGVATLGPGTYFALYADLAGNKAKAHLLPKEAGR
jgi:hypothetical protein